MSKINKTPIETRLAIERRSAAMLPDRPTQAGFKPWEIRNALFSAIIADKGACLMGEIDRIVDEANAAIDALRIKRGTLTVPMSRWKEEETPRAECVVESIYTAGCAVLFMPEDDETKEQARLARLSMAINETVDGEWSDVVIFVGEGGEIPSADLHFRYIVMPTESEEDAVVTLVGVDAYGEVGGTASGVDENAVRKIITAMLGKVVNERQYSASNPPPYPVTKVNGKTGDVSLSAADVGAEINGTASALLTLHDVNVEAHGGALAQIPILQNLLTTVIGTDTGKSMRAVAALVVAEIVGDASDSFDTLEEIAAWIEAHPDCVAALVARIVKLEAEIVTKIAVESIVNNLTTNDATKPLSAAQGYALKALLDALTTTVDGKTTPSQVQDAISKALVDYAKADHNHDGTYAKPADIPTKLSQLTGDSTHRTVTDTEKTGWSGKADGDHNHDGKYQPVGSYLTQHQSLSHLLQKNQGAENAGKIMAVAADGSVTYISVSDLGVSGDLVGNFADDGSIVLITPLDVGTYDLYTEDGRLYGKMTVEAAKAKYTVTFVADGVTVDVVEYTEVDETLSRVPTVPAKDGYTGVWESYTLDNKNITVNAIYTAIPVEPEFTNLIDEAGFQLNKRISNSGGGETTATKTIVLTGPLPVENYGDVFHVRGVDSLTPPSDGTGDYAGKFSCWDSNKGFIAGTLKSFPASCVGTDANGDFTLTYTADWGAAAGTAYVRLQFYDKDGSVPSLIVTRNQLIPK